MRNHTFSYPVFASLGLERFLQLFLHGLHVQKASLAHISLWDVKLDVQSSLLSVHVQNHLFTHRWVCKELPLRVNNCPWGYLDVEKHGVKLKKLLDNVVPYIQVHLSPCFHATSHHETFPVMLQAQ